MCRFATSLFWTRKIKSQEKKTIPCAAASTESGARRPAGWASDGVKAATAMASIANAIPVKNHRSTELFVRDADAIW
jgi:hypothetical protein